MRKLSLFEFIRFVKIQLSHPDKALNFFNQDEHCIFFKAPFRNNFIYILTQPADIEYIFSTNPSNYKREPISFIDINKEIIGRYGPLAPQIWAKDRIVIENEFKKDKIQNYVPLIVETTLHHLQILDKLSETNSSLFIDSYITELTLKNLAQTVFGGIEIDIPHTTKQVRELLYLLSPINFPKVKLFNIPMPLFFKFKSLQREFSRITASIVEKALCAPRDNIISNLAKVYGYSNNQIDKNMKEHLKATAFRFLMAGFDAVSALLTHTIALLSLNPLVAETMREEIKKTLGMRNPNYEDCRNLPYTRAIIQETLRLYPPFMWIARACLKEDKINSLNLNKGDKILIPININQKNQNYWINPEAFDPRRFLQPLSKEQRYLYIPFGMGKGSCLASQYAIFQATIILVLLYQRFQLFLTPGSTLERQPGLMNRINEHASIRVYKN